MFEIIENGTVTSPKGYLAGATNVGIKTDTDELDVGILWTNNKDAYCTGVFTQNSIVSHSVTASKQNINGKTNAREFIPASPIDSTDSMIHRSGEHCLSTR